MHQSMHCIRNFIHFGKVCAEGKYVYILSCYTYVSLYRYRYRETEKERRKKREERTSLGFPFPAQVSAKSYLHNYQIWCLRPLSTWLQHIITPIKFTTAISNGTQEFVTYTQKCLLFFFFVMSSLKPTE